MTHDKHNRIKYIQDLTSLVELILQKDSLDTRVGLPVIDRKLEKVGNELRQVIIDVANNWLPKEEFDEVIARLAVLKSLKG